MKISINERFTTTEIEATADELRASRSLGESLASALTKALSYIGDASDSDTEDAEANGEEEADNDKD